MAGDLLRLRLRSGDYPPLPAADGGHGYADTGGTGLPLECSNWLHRPSLSGEGAHPLQRAAAVEFYGAPVGLSDFAVNGQGRWLVLEPPELYVADHRRYSRGGGYWALQWLLQEEDEVEKRRRLEGRELAGGSKASDVWARRCLALLTAARSLADGEVPEAAIEAMSSWAFDASSWLQLRGEGWHEGLFTALALVAELLCHRAAAAAAGTEIPPGRLPRSRSCAQPPAADLKEPEGCFGRAAASALLEAAASRALPGEVAVLGLVQELLRGCDVRTAAGAAAWHTTFRRLATAQAFPMPLSGEEASSTCSVDLLAHRASAPRTAALGARLCGDEPVGARGVRDALALHVLGVSLHVAGEAPPSPGGCLVAEVVLYAASADRCYITQAGSNLRTAPRAFLEDWSCALSIDQSPTGARTAWSSGSAISAFGVDTVVRCGFRINSALLALLQGGGGSGDRDAGGLLAFLHLRSSLGTVSGVPLCSPAAGPAAHRGAHAAAGGHPPPAPPSGRAAAASDEPPALLAPPGPQPARLLTVCTGVLFNADQMLPDLPGPGGGSGPKAPSLLLQWLAYHEVVGVDHFVVYDSDGSAESAVASRVEQGTVTYFPRWPSKVSAKLGSISVSPHCRHCLSAQAEVHCLWMNRGISRWVIMLHSFDAYVAVAQGHGPHNPAGRHYTGAKISVPLQTLEPVRSKTGTVAVPMMDFGGPARNSSWLVGRFRRRAANPVQVLAEIGRGNPEDSSWLNHPGCTLRNPENVVGVLDHYSRSRPGAMDIEAPYELLRVNHYVDTFGERCSSRFAHCETPDDGILWALPEMCRRLGVASCCLERPCGDA